MIPKFKAFCKRHKCIEEVFQITYLGDNDIKVEAECLSGYVGSDFILMQSTGLYDKHGVEIFEGDIIQEVHAYEYANVEIETDYLEPFEIKKGNYVQGKWIAKEIGTEDFSVIGYVFGKNVKVIGDIYQNPELLEDV